MRKILKALLYGTKVELPLQDIAPATKTSYFGFNVSFITQIICYYNDQDRYMTWSMFLDQA